MSSHVFILVKDSPHSTLCRSRRMEGWEGTLHCFVVRVRSCRSTETVMVVLSLPFERESVCTSGKMPLDPEDNSTSVVVEMVKVDHAAM